MTDIYKIIQCDRCKCEVRLKMLKATDKELDGGYTRYVDIRYESAPEGWVKRERLDLCPECENEYNKWWETFMSDSEVDNGD